MTRENLLLVKEELLKLFVEFEQGELYSALCDTIRCDIDWVTNRSDREELLAMVIVVMTKYNNNVIPSYNDFFKNTETWEAMHNGDYKTFYNIRREILDLIIPD